MFKRFKNLFAAGALAIIAVAAVPIMANARVTVINNPPKVDFGQGNSAVVENGDLHIVTDNFLKLDVPHLTTVSGGLAVQGAFYMFHNGNATNSFLTFNNGNATHLTSGTSLWLNAPDGVHITTQLNVAGAIVGNVVGNAATATALAADPTDCAAGAFANAIDAMGNLTCSVDGSSLQNLNASNITSGTLADARLSTNVALKNIDNNFSTGQTITGGLDVFGGNVNLHFNNLHRVNNIGTNSHRANNIWTTNVDASNNITAFSFNAGAGNFNGNLTGNADTATTLAADPSNCTPSTQGFATGIQIDGTADCSTDGSALTSLNASNITSGTLNDARLSSNVALLDRTGQIFTGDNTVKVTSPAAFQVQDGSATPVFTVDTATNLVRVEPNNGLVVDLGNIDVNNGGVSVSGTVAAGSFSGDGGALTGLDASALSFGTVSDARLSSNVAKYNDASPNFTNTVTAAGFMGPLTGNVTGNSATASAFDHTPNGCTVASTFATSIAANGDLGCAGITSSDLPANVAYTNVANDFTQNQTIDGDLTINSGQINVNSGTINLDPFSKIDGGGPGGGTIVGTLIDNTNSINGGGLQGGTVPDSALSGNVTLQGNSFNNANQLVRLDGSGNLPAVDGSALTSLTGANVVGAVSDSNKLGGFGSAYYLNASNISSGTLSVSVGGTGANDAAGARTNLGLGSISTQDASNVSITGGAAAFDGALSATSTVNFAGATSMRVPNVGAPACGAGNAGDIVWSTIDLHFYGCNGTTWKQLDN